MRNKVNQVETTTYEGARGEWEEEFTCPINVGGVFTSGLR